MSGRGVLVALILTATAAFVVGVGLERHETRNETAETPAQRAAEGSGGEAATAHSGVDPESTGLLAVAVVVSLLLAAGVWWLGASPLVLGVVALAMAAFAALDVREVVHQVDESRTGLALLAALVAVLHLAAAVLAARAAGSARGVQPPPVSAEATQPRP